MDNVIAIGRRTLTISVVVTTIAWAVGLSMLLVPLTVSGQVTVAAGDNIRGSLPSVYHYGSDLKRHPFFHVNTWNTWYANFTSVKSVSDTQLAGYMLGSLAPVKAGMPTVVGTSGPKLVKITTDPKVYQPTCQAGTGTKLRHVASEAVAAALYGANWNQKIVDLPDAEFAASGTYTIGTAINAAGELNQGTEFACSTISEALSLAPPPSTSGLSVSVASDTPAPRSVIASAGNGGEVVHFLHLNFAATGGTVKVTDLKLKRGGISVDSDLDTIYLLVGGTGGKLIEMNSLSSNYANFNNPSGLFEVTAGQSQPVWVIGDVNRNALAGKTISFSLDKAADVTATGSTVVPTGSFPLTGNLMSVAQVLDLARLNVVAQANAATVDPGTSQFEDMRFTLTSFNQNVRVKKIKLTFIGTADVNDVQSYKLIDGSTQLGATIQVMAADKTVTFDFSASPLDILSGQTRTIRLLDDIIGGSGRNKQYSIQRRWHIEAWDNNYNAEIRPDTAVGTFAIVNSIATAINPGNLIMSLDPVSPSGNVPLNGTDRTLAIYRTRAVGEPIRVNQMTVQCTSDAFGGAANWTNIAQFRVLYDGAQVGTTQQALPEETTLPATTTLATNFTVPVTTTDKLLELRSNIAAAAGAGNAVANGETIQCRLVDNNDNNAQRTVSGGTFDAPAANINGNIVIASAANLITSTNPTVGNPALTIGSLGVRVASYLASAGSSEGVDVTAISVKDRNAAGAANGAQSLGAAYNNMKLMKGGTQIGQLITTNTVDAAGTVYTFNLSPVLHLNANEQVQIDLLADVITGAVWVCPLGACPRVAMANATGTASVTNTAVNAADGDDGVNFAGDTDTANGQQVILAVAGTLTTANDASTPVTQQYAMGTNGPTLATWRFSANTLEALNVSQVIVTNIGTSDAVANTLKLMVGGVQVGSTIASFSAGVATFAAQPGQNLFTIPAGGSALLSLTGVFTSFEAGAVSGTSVQGRINEPQTGTITGAAANTIIARGASGSFAATSNNTVGGVNRDGNAQFAYRSVFHATLTSVGTPARSVGELAARIGINASNSNGLFRGSLRANTESIADNNLPLDGAPDWSATGLVVAANATAPVLEGANTIRATEDGASAVNDLWQYDYDATVVANTPLNTFARASFWIRSSAARAAGDIQFIFSDTADVLNTGALETTNPSPAVNVPAMATANEWYYAEAAIAPVATNQFLIFYIGANPVNNATIDIDDLRLYNDALEMNVSGNLSANVGPINVAKGSLFEMRQSGIVRAVGRYTGTGGAAGSGVVRFIPSPNLGNAAASVGTDVAFSSGLVNYDVNIDTATGTGATLGMMATDTVATEVLNMSMVFGTPATPGGFRWLDNYAAAAGTVPWTWVNAVVNGILQPTPQSLSRAY